MYLQKLIEAKEAAHSEGLRYVEALETGFSRRRKGKRFAYFDQKAKPIKDSSVIDRINKIGIPPAYNDVWICPYANGHIQAIGVDARGRKQYRYHVLWRATRDKDKFEHMLRFGKMLPLVRRTVSKDLKQVGITRAKLLATVVSLLERTLIRVGNNEYARQNESYGLTTLRRKHVDVSSGTIRFHFMGKSGKKWEVALHDKRLASIVKRCSDLPGHDLFKYVDDNGDVHAINSSDINGYLKEITQEDFTAKDFRTWAGTVLAALSLGEFEKYDSLAVAKKNVVRAIEKVAKQLGNTPSICRKCYIHPEIISAYLSGDTIRLIENKIEKKMRLDYGRYSADEVLVLAFLRRRLSAQKRQKPAGHKKN